MEWILAVFGIGICGAMVLLYWKIGCALHAVEELSKFTVDLSTGVRAIGECVMEISERLKKLELEEQPNMESARRAMEEIKQFNEGIANILSYGNGEKKDGDGR